MRHGFDVQGGFYVVDDAARVGCYAYPTSDHAEAASKSAYHAGQVALRMIANENVWARMYHSHIVSAMYARCITVLGAPSPRFDHEYVRHELPQVAG